MWYCLDSQNISARGIASNSSCWVTASSGFCPSWRGKREGVAGSRLWRGRCRWGHPSPEGRRASFSPRGGGELRPHRGVVHAGEARRTPRAAPGWDAGAPAFLSPRLRPARARAVSPRDRVSEASRRAESSVCEAYWQHTPWWGSPGFWSC